MIPLKRSVWGLAGGLTAIKYSSYARCFLAAFLLFASSNSTYTGGGKQSVFTDEKTLDRNRLRGPRGAFLRDCKRSAASPNPNGLGAGAEFTDWNRRSFANPAGHALFGG